jgi:FHS family L-fucose permease-like MFS transporter
MFPTIFAEGIKNLGDDTRYGSSLLVMTIVGGALMPVCMGGVSDVAGIRLAYLVPVISFIVIAGFTRKVVDS